MRKSRYILLASLLSTLLISACSQGGSPLGLADDAETTGQDSLSTASIAEDGTRDTGASAAASNEETGSDAAAEAAPAADEASGLAATQGDAGSTDTASTDAGSTSAVDSILAAKGETGAEPDASSPAEDAGVASEDSPESVLEKQRAAVQPEIQASPSGLLLATDLEDESTDCWNGNRTDKTANPAGCGDFKSIGFRPFSLAENGIAHSGRKAIDITYARNEEVGGTNVGISAEAVNVRAYYYFEPGFDFGQGMKIGRVSSFNASTQKNDVDIILEARSAKGNQCGVTDMRDVGLFFNGAPKGSDWGNVASTMSFERGRWYSLEYQVVLNTPGKADGIVRLWVDGVQVAEKTNLKIRGKMGHEVKLNTVKIGGWYSNGAGGNSCANPSQPARMHMDDIVISKSYIGLSQPVSTASR